MNVQSLCGSPLAVACLHFCIICEQVERLLADTARSLMMAEDEIKRRLGYSCPSTKAWRREMKK